MRTINSESTLSVEHDLRDQLTSMVEADKTQLATAQQLGITNVYLGEILRGRRGVSEKVAERLGWRKMTVFVR